MDLTLESRSSLTTTILSFRLYGARRVNDEAADWRSATENGCCLKCEGERILSLLLASYLAKLVGISSKGYGKTVPFFH